MKSIFGYGSLILRNSDSSTIVLFQNTMHNVTFLKSNLRQVSITGLLHLTLIVYRPLITADIIICNDNDIIKLINLVTLLNNYTTEGLFVAPQYSVDNSDNNLYLVYLNNTVVDFEHIANALIGQLFKLLLIGRTITKMPTNYSNTNIHTLVNNTGDFIITSDGDGITIII